MIANVTRVSYETRVKLSGIEDEVEMPHSELRLEVYEDGSGATIIRKIWCDWNSDRAGEYRSNTLPFDDADVARLAFKSMRRLHEASCGREITECSVSEETR